ncbi:hypothetical protein D3C73_1550290 [compost metagenome]
MEIEGEETQTLAYEYGSRRITAVKGKKASASIPQITTVVSLEPVNTECLSAEAEEGHLFNPYFTLKLNYTLSEDRREAATCLAIRKV